MKSFKSILMLLLILFCVILLIVDATNAGWLRGSSGGCPGGQCPTAAPATTTLETNGWIGPGKRIVIVDPKACKNCFGQGKIRHNITMVDDIFGQCPYATKCEKCNGLGKDNKPTTIDVPVVVNVVPAIQTKIIETAKKEPTATASRPIAAKLKATAKAPFRLLFRRQ